MKLGINRQRQINKNADCVFGFTENACLLAPGMQIDIFFRLKEEKKTLNADARHDLVITTHGASGNKMCV